MELTNHIDAFVAGASGIIASITAYVQGKKNAKSIELDNIEKAIVIYKDAAEYLKNELEDMKGEVETIKKNHEDCEESKARLERKIDELDRKVCKLNGES